MRSEEVDNTTGCHSPYGTLRSRHQYVLSGHLQSANRALGRNMGNKVICEPPIEELCDHPSIIASPHICTSNSTLQRVVRKTFPRKNVHGRDHTTCCTCCNKRSNLALGIRMHRIHVFLVSHTKNSRGFRTKREPRLVCIPNALWLILQSMLMHKFGIVYKPFIEPFWCA